MVVEETPYKIKINDILNMKADIFFLQILSAITNDRDKLFCLKLLQNSLV